MPQSSRMLRRLHTPCFQHTAIDALSDSRSLAVCVVFVLRKTKQWIQRHAALFTTSGPSGGHICCTIVSPAVDPGGRIGRGDGSVWRHRGRAAAAHWRARLIRCNVDGCQADHQPSCAVRNSMASACASGSLRSVVDDEMRGLLHNTDRPVRDS